MMKKLSRKVFRPSRRHNCDLERKVVTKQVLMPKRKVFGQIVERRTTGGFLRCRDQPREKGDKQHRGVN